MATGKRIDQLDSLNEILDDDLLVVLDDSETVNDKTKQLKAEVLLKKMSERASNFIDGLNLTYVNGDEFTIGTGSCVSKSGDNELITVSSPITVSISDTSLYSQVDLDQSDKMVYVFLCKSASTGSVYVRLSSARNVILLADNADSYRYIGSVGAFINTSNSNAFEIYSFAQSGSANVRVLSYQASRNFFYTQINENFTVVSFSTLSPTTQLENYLEAKTWANAPSTPFVGNSTLYVDIRENNFGSGSPIMTFKPFIYQGAGDPGLGIADQRSFVMPKNKFFTSGFYVTTGFRGDFVNLALYVRGFSEEV